MNTEVCEINVTLSNDQKEKIKNAYLNREDIRIRLSKDALRGRDNLIIIAQTFKGLDDAPDGIDAIIDESTANEMWEEFNLNNEYSTDDMWEEFNLTTDDMWEYYGLCFTPAVLEGWENKGIEISLNYSLLKIYKYIIL